MAPVTVPVFDPRPCTLGEGALWHPERQELFWFDITGKRLLSRNTAGSTSELALPEMCSAAGIVDRDTLFVASETALNRFDIASSRLTPLLSLEADRTENRSNDGRADPKGGFWIGTMGKAAEVGAGAVYRYHKGELRKLIPEITIPNAICFAPDGSRAYVADTMAAKLYTLPLDAEGWPEGDPEVLLDLHPLGLEPDGAVTDAAGHLHIACWGAGLILTVAADGTPGARTPLPAPHPTCPAFGGPDLTRLYVTTATQGLLEDALAAAPQSGRTFELPGYGQGRPEPTVLLEDAP